MSYDVYLSVDAGGPEPVSLPLDWNYTSNCACMWDAAGAPIRDFHGKRAGDCASLLADAIATMEREPERFIAMNPPNGWGSYESLLPRLRVLLEAFRNAPNAIVEVSR